MLALLAGPAQVNAAGLEKRRVTDDPPDATADSGDSSERKPGSKRRITIQSSDEDGGKEAKEIAWLGLGAEEASEALASQLGLKHGEGLVVTFVVPDSPAAKAGFQKNDVLAEFDDQLLVHPGQFRKLVRMHKEGDTVKLTIYRTGKRQNISATLGKTTSHAGLFLEDRLLPGDLNDLNHGLRLQINEGLHEHMKALHESLARAGVDKEKLGAEIKRSLEQAHVAVVDAARNAPKPHREIARVAKDLEELVRAAVGVDKDATVIVRNNRKSINTIVQTDDAGTYVIVAGPKKRLTAHDKNGKMLFDGAIDTPEQQEKVPKEVWQKVKPMLDKLGTYKLEKPDAERDSE